MSEHETEAEKQEGFCCTRLAEMPPRTILDEGELAQSLRICKRTVRRMVARFELPPPVPFAGRNVWTAGAILDHFDKRAQRAADEASRAERTLQSRILSVK